ncbi:MAG: 1-(5-phosphoribosyl)-5-[Oscillospiraceae bacterium]|nr:1-(5-phosphoribosyl)-5-[(5-phosphoribosylamino)methylideneamino]imidazole-4-carboxamide isomerase [Oscillospiraceae bacterium]
MLIFPAIDLYNGKAVRLYKGDYAQMTVYSENPPEIAEVFYQQGAGCLHLVDLEGAKTGETPNLETIRRIRASAPLFTEVGGGVRSMAVVERYLEAGIDRVILGTAAVTDPAFLREAVGTYKEKIAVGVDIRDGKVAIHGWTEKSTLDAFDFCRELQSLGVQTIICTDISRDGAMQGTNRTLYGELSKTFSLNIIASGGVSSIDDIKALRALDLYGAIIGKAYYTGAIDLKEALEAAK